MDCPRSVSFIGAGNVATHFATALRNAGCRVVQVCANSMDSASVLAARVNAEPIDSLEKINPDVDFIIIAATDTATPDIASRIPAIHGVVAHTSGSVPLDALSAYHERAAVIYPLQTFSKDVPVDMMSVPVFTEATDEATLLQADELAAMFSKNVRHADSSVRSHLHIAGVFACNFPVFMLEQARLALAEADLPLETVRPLVEATIEKAFTTGPLPAMTGPARRGDIATLRRHIDSLPAQQQDVYRIVSEAILKTFNHEQDSISS